VPSARTAPLTALCARPGRHPPCRGGVRSRPRPENCTGSHLRFCGCRGLGVSPASYAVSVTTALPHGAFEGPSSVGDEPASRPDAGAARVMCLLSKIAPVRRRHDGCMGAAEVGRVARQDAPQFLLGSRPVYAFAGLTHSLMTGGGLVATTGLDSSRNHPSEVFLESTPAALPAPCSFGGEGSRWRQRIGSDSGQELRPAIEP
jgi:hypothetical protein